jgi:hypothetical protein
VTVPLPIPDDPLIAELLAAWPDPARWPYRSRWLHDLEAVLRAHYPQASSDQLTYTARQIAPFPLAIPNVG